MSRDVETPTLRQGRELLRLAGSALVGWLLYLAWPWLAPADDAFRTTIAVLPAVAAALGWLGRDAARRSGRRAERASWLEAALVLLVVVSLPFRYALGWSPVDGPWAAALALALAAAVRRRLLDLRPLLGGRLAAHGGSLRAHFFLLPLIVYLAVQPWALESRPPDGDEPYNLLIAHSLVFDLDTDLRNQYDDGDSLRFMSRSLEPQTGDPVARDGSQQSRHSLILPLAIALPYAVAGRAGAAALMAVLSAALPWLCLRLMRRALSMLDLGRRSDTGAFLAWGVLAFLSPLVVYAHQLWVEVPAALLTALALDRILTPSDATVTGRRRKDLALAALLVALPLLKLRFGLLSAGLLALALLTTATATEGSLRHRLLRHRLWRVAGPGVVAAAALLGVWWWRYGNPLKVYTRGELSTLTGSPWHYVRGLLGLFYDCAFGLFATAPLWVLMLPGLVWLLRSTSGRRLAGHLALVGGPYLLVVAPRLEWYGGWSPPFRYALVLLPVLAVLLARALAERRQAGVRFLLVLLGVPTLFLTLLWVVSPPWTYNLADGYSYLLQQAGVILGADVGRFFPSLVRPRLATWLWVALSLGPVAVALVPKPAGRAGRSQVRRWAGAAGLCLLLVLAAALPLAVHRVPTGQVQVEDLWITKRGGVQHPALWKQRRPETAGGWLIGRGNQMILPAVAGGARARVEIRVLRFRLGIDTLHADLLLPDGSRQEIKSWRVTREGEWRNLVVESFDWPKGASLLLYHPGPYRDTRQGLVIDWVDFRWLTAQ